MKFNKAIILQLFFIIFGCNLLSGCDMYENTARSNNRAISEESYRSMERMRLQNDRARQEQERIRLEQERIKREEVFKATATVRSEQASSFLTSYIHSNFSDKRVRTEPSYIHVLEYCDYNERYSVANVIVKWSLKSKYDVEVEGKLYTYPESRIAVFKCTYMCKTTSRLLKRAVKEEILSNEGLTIRL